MKFFMNAEKGRSKTSCQNRNDGAGNSGFKAVGGKGVGPKDGGQLLPQRTV